MAGRPNSRGPDWVPSSRAAHPFTKDSPGVMQPGNDSALTHGAYSERQLAPIVEQLEREIVEVAPWCAQPAFRAEVAAWARAEASVRLTWAWLTNNGMLDADGAPLPANDLHDKREAAAARARERLGLTPNAWAKLVARLGAADGEAAARGLQSLKAVGKELAERTALPQRMEDDDG